MVREDATDAIDVPLSGASLMGFFTVTGIIVWGLVALAVVGFILLTLIYAGLCWWRFYRLRQIMLRRDAQYARDYPRWSVPFKVWVTITWRYITGWYDAAEHCGVIVPLNPFARLRHRYHYWSR